MYYLLNYQTVLIDEAKSSGSWSEKAQLINTLKTIITEGSVGIRQLYKEYSEQDTITNYWINTNYRDAFPRQQMKFGIGFIFVLINETKKCLMSFTCKD